MPKKDIVEEKSSKPLVEYSYSRRHIRKMQLKTYQNMCTVKNVLQNNIEEVKAEEDTVQYLAEEGAKRTYLKKKKQVS